MSPDQQWQCEQVAHAMVDNAINTRLAEMSPSTRLRTGRVWVASLEQERAAESVGVCEVGAAGGARELAF